MTRADSTRDVDYFAPGGAPQPQPGVLLVHTAGAPMCGPIPLLKGELIVGRGAISGVTLEDPSLSRRHARITFAEGRFQVEDLGSRNGLVLDGLQVSSGQAAPPGGRILRLGGSVFILSEDLRPYLRRPLVRLGSVVVGPVLGEAWDALDSLARTSEILHLHAESGSGKELAARRFHERGPHASGPFVAVNCAAIPEGVAERLLFGANKGAFSGATADVQGYFESANGGTLFLDEVGDLDLDVQAKLLRVIETREVLPLGSTRARRVEIRLVSATHRDLRRTVKAGRFREDLFFRLCRPVLELPPLRDRPEEIGYLAAAAAARIYEGSTLSAAFAEACLLRPWPGNVRELVLEVEDAARRARAAAQSLLEPNFLDPEAGHRLADETPAEKAPSPHQGPRTLPSDEVIEAALARAEGKVATAARNLGIHRTQLRRWLALRKAPSPTDDVP